MRHAHTHIVEAEEYRGSEVAVGWAVIRSIPIGEQSSSEMLVLCHDAVDLPRMSVEEH